MKLTENQIEQFTLGLFASLGYQYIQGIDLAPNREHQERENYSDDGKKRGVIIRTLRVFVSRRLWRRFKSISLS